MPGSVELQVTTNYSFLRGASRVEELLVQAKELGMEAIGVADHNTLAGIARAHSRAAEIGLRLVVGCRLDLRDGLPLLLYPVDGAGYGRLCRLLTLGKGGAGKAGCDLSWSDVAAAAEGLLVILLPDAVDDALDQELRRLRAAFPGRCHLALTLRRRPGDWVRLRQLFDAAQAVQVPTVVTGEGVLAEHAAELNLEDRRLRLAITIARQLIGLPRQLGTHPGGFVLTRDRLDELVPVEPAAMVDRQVIEWDKDDIDNLKWMKVDVLGLGDAGLHTAFVRVAGAALEQGARHRQYPGREPETDAIIRKADTLGTFQIESRAQMSMLPRLKPTTFYDLVVQVAIVRPGPIQGDMVRQYLRRREKLEPVFYPKPELQRVLGKTLGVPLFQEQAMQVSIYCAGFTPGEADPLRRFMATFKITGGVSRFRDKLIEGMVANGTRRSSPNGPLGSSRGSAATASPRATPPRSPRRPMPAPG